MESAHTIVKRRPSRPTEDAGTVPMAEPPAPQPVPEPPAPQPEHEDSVESYSESNSESDADPEPRDTCDPTTTQNHHPVEYDEESSNNGSEAAIAQESSQADIAEDESKPQQLSVEDVSAPRHVETEPRAVVKTARPAGKAARRKTPKKSTRAAPPATASAAAPKPKPKAGKKPLRKVNLRNVERVAPIAQGVNTPRSLRVCEEAGVNPAELAPRKLEDFASKGVAEEIVALRYRSYESRRKARMAQLLPAYEAAIEAKKDAKDGLSNTERHGKDGSNSEVSEDEHAAAMMRQMIEARALEEEKQQSQQQSQHQSQHRSNYHSQHRRSGNTYSPRSAGGRGTSPRSSTFYSTGMGHSSPMSPGAAKIHGRCLNESRSPNATEQAMLNEINNRDLHRSTVLERAYLMEESQELVKIEALLTKDTQVADRLHEMAMQKEQKQHNQYMNRLTRQAEALQRREAMEKQRQGSLSGSM